MKTITFSEEELTLAREVFERAVSDVYQSATAEEFEDEKLEREKMGRPARKMEQMSALGTKFS